jgi:lactoylglutathione lyase
MSTLTLSKTGHIGLNVRDLAISAKFYVDILGLKEMRRSDVPGREYVFFGDGQSITLTLWQQSSTAFNKSISGLHHLSFEAASMDDVRKIEERVRAKNVRLFHDGIVSHAEGADSGGIFFEDPDGIRLEVSANKGAGGYAPALSDAPTCGFF